MKRTGILLKVTVIICMFCLNGCDKWFGADATGKINLSSQKLGTDTFYLMGYLFEESDYFKYPFQGESIPDIINEEYRIIDGGQVVSLPGFNTPATINGFALVGEFSSLESARNFYSEYQSVEEGLQFETVSDTVELYQVWIQKTGHDNYVKMLVSDIRFFEDDSGSKYNEVSLEYTYQSDGSVNFPD